MRSMVKSRLMALLLDSIPHTEQELASGLGFHQAETIQHATRSFAKSGYITRIRNEGGAWTCQLVCTREIASEIYDSRQFASLRPMIRKTPWFGPLFTRDFSRLQAGLSGYIGRMVQDSHSFFLIIRTYSTPEKMREIFQPLIFVPRLFDCRDKVLEDYLLYYILFVQSVIQDIEHGGLGEGFADTISTLKDRIRTLYAEASHNNGMADSREKLKEPLGNISSDQETTGLLVDRGRAKRRAG